MIELIIGGARSGKSRLAETHALASNKRLIYIATAQPKDGEMSARIQEHKARRDEQWLLVEEPINLADTLKMHAKQDTCILVDCLTLWLSNTLHCEFDSLWPQEKASLLKCLPELPGDIILVSNEVGLGIIPMGEITRQFVDESGWLHQALAEISNKVILTIAGLPHTLKDDTPLLTEDTYTA